MKGPLVVAVALCFACAACTARGFSRTGYEVGRDIAREQCEEETLEPCEKGPDFETYERARSEKRGR